MSGALAQSYGAGFCRMHTNVIMLNYTIERNEKYANRKMLLDDKMAQLAIMRSQKSQVNIWAL